MKLLGNWQMDQREMGRRMYRAPTARAPEGWHGLRLLARGWTATEVAEALERDDHTIGNWLANFSRAGARGLVVEQTGGSPPPSVQAKRVN